MNTKIALFICALGISSCGSFKSSKLDRKAASVHEEDLHHDSSSRISKVVDSLYKNNELEEARNYLNGQDLDHCNKDTSDDNSFSLQISYYVEKMFSNMPSMIGFISDSYGIKGDDNSIFPTSLIRHPLCELDKQTLTATLGSKRVPSQSVIDKANNFSKTFNDLRLELKNGNIEAGRKLHDHWNTLFSCLAYTESLSSVDNPSSKKNLDKYLETDARDKKQLDINFYEDSEQPIESRLNIGLFQFTPNSKGNIRPCIKAWNVMNSDLPKCKINVSANQKEMIHILASPLQGFNAFCGIHKLIETFSIQVNTLSKTATHPYNIVNGKIKAPSERCVSPHFLAGKAYNHFGPFQNSTRTNMEELYSCIENYLKD